VLLVVPEYPVLLEILVAQHYQNLLLVPLGPVVLVFLFLLVVPDYINKKKKKKKNNNKKTQKVQEYLQCEMQ
jgi:putative copper export protein